LSPDSRGDPSSPDDLRALGDFLLQEPLKNSVRVLILVSLGINRHLGFTDLLELTGVSKGSLSHHLDQLGGAGFVRSGMVFTLAGPRVRVEITAQGLEVFERLTQTLAQIATRGTGAPPTSGSAAEPSS
jgi:DNA-binding MarR family transcriptional regulator